MHSTATAKPKAKAKRGSNASTPFILRALRAVLGGSAAGQVFLLVLLAAAGILALWRVPVTWRALGYGIWIVIPFLLVFSLVARFKPRATARNWQVCLACMIWGLMAWGVLGFMDGAEGPLQQASLGGHFGRQIIVGGQGVVGALRLLGLAILSIVVLAPAWSWKAFRATTIYAGRAFWGAYLLAGRGAWWLGMRIADQAKIQGPRLGHAAQHLGAAIAQRVTALLHRGSAPQPADSESAATGTVPLDGAALPTATATATAVAASPTPRADGVPEFEEETPTPVAGEDGQEGSGKNGSNRAEVAVPAGSHAEMLVTGRGNPDGWRLPSMDALDRDTKVVVNQADNRTRARGIEEALKSYGIEASVVEIHPGPAVTQFGLEPGWVRKFKEVKLRDEEGKPLVDKNGKQIVKREETARTRVKVDAIANLDKDLAMALAASSIRIEAPIPGKALVGIEVPNMTSETVTLRSGIDSPEFRKLKDKAKLPIVLGKGNGGQVEVADLAKMPHVLVAGATGSGKSIGIRATLLCLLMNKTPRELRLLLVDPKRVELVAFNSVPHLLTPAIVDVEKVVDALRWATLEMDERYKRFQAMEVRDLEAYNKHKVVADPLPYLVIVIDELADLMMTAPFDVETCITRLAQLGRAAGIHLIVATQRPSVNVVTGLIKANFPTRLSFAVSSQIDSRTILDTGGAEKLLGKGDMLFLPQDASKPRRIQGVYVSDAEVERVVHAWNTQRAYLGPTHFPKPATESTSTATSVPSDAPSPAHPQPPAVPMTSVPEEKDPLMPKAREIAEQFSRISPSLLQRKLKIGYNKASRLMELLEQEGYGAEEEEDVF